MSNMKSVVAVAAITLASGRLKLSDAQASSRKHSLKAIKADSGIYEIKFPVQFKAGERFGYDGEIPKSMLDVFVDPKEAAAREREQAEARARDRQTIAAGVRADVCTAIREGIGKLELPDELRAKVVEVVNAAEAA